MTNARSEIVDSENVGVYHCISRCVRRAFLCGKDKYSGQCFEHRRLWIRLRLKLLVEVFSIEVIAYAVMMNHLHSLIRTRPDIAKKWDAAEVARRWRTLFPLRKINGNALEPSPEEIQAIAGNKKLVELYRARLSSLSWFNRCLNENIARRANTEDDCTGRFWEGRFKCQRVFDIAAIIACSAYVDLNPVRAGISKTPEESDYTSVQDRIFEHTKTTPSRCENWPIIPLVSIPEITNNLLSVTDYLKLVDETGRLLRYKKASISENIAPILDRLRINQESWLDTTRELRRHFKRVVGPEEQIKNAATRAMKNWFHGLRSARRLFGNSNCEYFNMKSTES